MSRAKSVLITADTVGGVWTYAIELCRGLAQRGFRIALATMGGPVRRSQWAEAEAIPRLELFESNYKLEWMDSPWEDIECAGAWLLEVERRFAPELIHLNQFCFGALPFRAPVLVVGHSCVRSWWRAVKCCDVPHEWERYRREVSTGLAGADLVVAPSHAMLNSLQEHYGPLQRTAVAPNGRSHPADGAPAPLTPRQPLIFSSGRIWDEAKNLATLEQAAPLLPWPIYVAGDSRNPNGAQRRSSACRVLGRLDERAMNYWMSQAAIYASPALYEPFGLAILEAAIAGCALVLGDIPSSREIWNGAAVFAPPRNPAEFARAMRRLIDQPGERLLLASRARQRASEFGASRMVENYLNLYRALTVRGGPLQVIATV